MSLNPHRKEEKRPGGGRWVTASPMQMMVVLLKQLRAGEGLALSSTAILSPCETRGRSLRHSWETSEHSAAVAASQGSGPAHVPPGDEAHQGTGVRRLQEHHPQGLVSFFQPGAGQRPGSSPALIPLAEPEE